MKRYPGWLRTQFPRLLGAAVPIAITLLVMSPLASAANFIVNSLEDTHDANPGDGVCVDATGACTLRAAIEEANSNGDPDTISFEVEGTISLTLGSLVLEEGATTIAGPGLRVAVDGLSNPTDSDSFILNSDGNVIRGLIIINARRHGVYITGARNIIGGTEPDQRNVVSYSVGSGIEVYGSAARQNTILGNYIGTDPTGSYSQVNSSGVRLLGGAEANTIGGGTSGARNIISGNQWYGVYISNGSYNTIAGNYIGTDVTGTLSLGNNQGISVSGTGNVIGGDSPELGNLISGNGIGLRITLRGTETRVEGNLIGTDAVGTTAIGNDTGILIADGAMHNTVGGLTPHTRNIISGNRYDGIRLSSGTTSQNSIVGNYIGTDITGLEPLGNGRYGIELDFGTHGNRIGGESPEARNVIASNGIGVRMSQTTNNIVSGNFIGLDAGGSRELGNGIGILLQDSAAANMIGGDQESAGNWIAFNGTGVKLAGLGTRFNTIRHNSIRDNQGLGIEIAEGAQDGLEPPLIRSAFLYNVTGVAASSGMIIDVYLADQDPSGAGEGKRFLGTGITDASGQFDIPISGVALDDAVTATVTDRVGNTSTFAVNVRVKSAPNVPPVADAGPDQVVSAWGAPVVQLDGSGSYDPDGDDLTYHWTVLDPDGNAVVLSDPTSVRPQFDMHAPGEYHATLRVSDGLAVATDSTTIIGNAPPHPADLSDQVVRVGQEVQLDATASYDPEGDELTYTWSLSKPIGSSAELVGADTATPRFVPDVRGDFRIELVLSDGIGESYPVSATITANAAPIADAGYDRTVRFGEQVSLDGSRSYDPERDPIGYEWRIIARPPGSAVELAGADSAAPSFSPDVIGRYVVELLVFDWLGSGQPDQVVITANGLPSADAGPDQEVLLGSEVFLTGTGSSDPDGTHLDFFWEVTTRPDGSTAPLTDARSPAPSIRPDRPGFYEVTLTIFDSWGESDSDTVQIWVRSKPVATFSVEPSSYVLTTADVVYFEDTSTDEDGEIVAWDWKFSDGGASSHRNPTYQYLSPGTYHVSLVVTDNDGLSSDPERKTLVVGTPDAPVTHATTRLTSPGVETIGGETLKGISVTKSGPGTPILTIARFDGNPLERESGFLAGDDVYFDVNLDSAAGVDSLLISWVVDGVIDSGRWSMMWYDESSAGWTLVEPYQVVEAPDGGVQVVANLDWDTSPSVSQITGTIFAAGMTPPPNAAPEVEILAPTAGTQWMGKQSIRWQATDPEGDHGAITVDLAYALEGGDWVDLATAEQNDGEYLWDTSTVPAGGVYRLRVTATDNLGASTEVTSDSFTVVKSSGLFTHGPNPASSSVTFYFSGGIAGSLYVYDSAGRLVWLADVPEGSPSLYWDLRSSEGAPLGNGLYLYLVVLQDGTRSDVRRLVIQR